MGPSGSGKSTLMNILGCLDTPTSGTYLLDGDDVSKLDDDELADIRNRDIGFVFQSFNLLPRATVHAQRARAAALLDGQEVRARARAAEAALGAAGLPEELLGPQRPTSCPAVRCSASPSPARSSTTRRSSSPTSRPATSTPRPASIILATFQRLNDEGRTIVLITHEPDVAEHAERIVHIQDGQILVRRAASASRGGAGRWLPMRLDDVIEETAFSRDLEQGALGADDPRHRRRHRLGHRDGRDRPGRAGVDHELDPSGGLQPRHGHAGLRRRVAGRCARRAGRRALADRGGRRGDRSRRSAASRRLAGALKRDSRSSRAPTTRTRRSWARRRRTRPSTASQIAEGAFIRRTTSRPSRASRSSARRRATTSSARAPTPSGKRIRDQRHRVPSRRRDASPRAAAASTTKTT